MKRKFTYLFFFILLLILTKISYPQVNYEFDFNKNWEWFDLYSSNPAISNQLIKNIQDLSKEWSIEEARSLFRYLTKLDSLNELLNIQKIIDTDSNKNKQAWKNIFAGELKYFGEPETFRGIISAAMTITRIKKSIFPERRLFGDRKFYIKITDLKDTSTRITYNFGGAADIFNLCAAKNIGDKELKIIDGSESINAMFRKNDPYFNKELFVNFLNLARDKKPLVEIYKLVNPYSFGGLGYLTTHFNEFRGVINSLSTKEKNLKFYSVNLLSQFFPRGAWLEANVDFLFGNFEANNNDYLEMMLVNLSEFGDDYEYLARYLTRKLFLYEKYNTQLDIFRYLYSNEDTLILKLMTEVYDGGISNYMAPILEDNRPLSLLEIDFFHFKATTNAILFKRKKSVVDSLLKAGFDGRFLFYTMGAQMAYTIDRTLGRTALNEALIYGPLEFFKIYTDAYEADAKQISDKFQFNSEFEQKIYSMRNKIPRDIYKEMYDINVKYKDPAPIPGVLEKIKKKYIDSRKDAFNFYLVGAQLLFDNEFYGKSLEYFNKIINELPDKNNVSRILGLAYYDKSAYNEAIEMFDNYVKFSPLSADSYLLRGKAYFMSAQYDKAKTDFEKSLQINSSNEEAKQLLEQVNENGL
jgi:hypothetical protein